jgi:hypothetical protein
MKLLALAVSAPACFAASKGSALAQDEESTKATDLVARELPQLEIERDPYRIICGQLIIP